MNKGQHNTFKKVSPDFFSTDTMRTDVTWLPCFSSQRGVKYKDMTDIVRKG